MNEKTLYKLEYDKIIDLLTEKASSFGGRSRCRRLKPMTSIEKIEAAQQETEAAFQRIVKKGRPSFGGCAPVNESLKRLEIGGTLGSGELLRICRLLENAGQVKAYGRRENGDESTDCLDGYFDQLTPILPLTSEIRRCILEEDEISDDASPALRQIRRQIGQINDKVHATLSGMVNGSLRTYLQDPIITMRGDRYCIPVKSEHRSQVPGMIHDQSSTGSTLFIEPMAVVKLNNDIYQNEKGLGENDRVYLVAASIIATLGIPGKVMPLEKDDLKSSQEEGNRDGDIVVRKIRAFLREKQLPEEKKELIVRTLQNTLTTDNINKAHNGESQLKRVFTKIVDDLGIYYKIGLTTDFTGKLFNEMYSWLGFSQDKLNDVVLTPAYVSRLLVKLARVNKDSYVWDFATGSAGLLVAAMNEMIIDAKNSLHSPEEFERKKAEIKARQLLGLEILSSVYMLAILNMILMGDGSSNILNKDSLLDFDGNYGFGDKGKRFPADAFVLNPPYSAKGNGMVFVERALSMMDHGYAAIIIQNSAGSGKAIEYNKNILKKSTLLASIKMPLDLFVGKSSVQTSVYVFRVGEAHQKDDVVKFIDFSNDGYTRTNRKKASCNLRDTDHAKERYQELVDLVRFGKGKLHYLTEAEYYEGTIDPQNGADWNQTAPVDTKPTLEDFKKTVSDYLAWEVANILKQENKEDERLGK